MNKGVVFKNDNVTVFKDGRWRCEKCHRAARERGIKPPGLMNPGENCRFIDEYGNKCNNHYSNEEDLEQMKQLAQSRREEEEANAPTPPVRQRDSGNDVEVVCHIFGEMLRCFTGAAFGQGVTRGRKTRGRKTRGRKRKKTKNTRYQKRAR